MKTHGRLTEIQQKVLDAFFAVERGFFLSGGGALVGFYLGHRETTDLDLFTSSVEAFDRARIELPIVLESIGGSLVVRQEAPGFRRVVVHLGHDDLVVDLVRDIGLQCHPKALIDGIVVDPLEEIFSNKLTTLVSRQEVRDLVDVLEIERRGLRAEDFLAEANAKDGGCTPATLAWLLSEWQIADGAKLPAGYSVQDLRAFKDSLSDRLARAAVPRGA
ncbi:MAG: nucleotidyl transferase AbiEii/AbiGii toxin family protein [Deltaproteobacteria bacterium]